MTAFLRYSLRRLLPAFFLGRRSASRSLSVRRCRAKAFRSPRFAAWCIARESRLWILGGRALRRLRATGLGRLAFFFLRFFAQYFARAAGCRLLRAFFFVAIVFLSRRPSLAISRKSLSSFKRSACDMRAPINGLDRCEALRARRCAVTFVRRGTIAGGKLKPAFFFF